jgi:hypothetical protein
VSNEAKMGSFYTGKSTPPAPTYRTGLKNKENINHSKNISTQIANKFFIPCRIKAYLDCQFIFISEPEMLCGSSPLLFVISCGVFLQQTKSR